MNGEYIEPPVKIKGKENVRKKKVQRKSKKPVQKAGKQSQEKPRINSRNKGANGEREFANLLTKEGFQAERGQQHSGGKDSPDVKCEGLTGVHFEVKRVQSGNLYKWLAQAIRDAKDNIPIVAHRRNNADWVAVLPMTELLKLLATREGTLL